MKLLKKRIGILIPLILISILFTNASNNPQPITFYVSAKGSDSNTGLDKLQPLATLKAVHDKIIDSYLQSPVIVYVIAKDGPFYGQSLTWKNIPEGGITFRPLEPDLRAKFIGLDVSTVPENIKPIIQSDIVDTSTSLRSELENEKKSFVKSNQEKWLKFIKFSLLDKVPDPKKPGSYLWINVGARSTKIKIDRFDIENYYSGVSFNAPRDYPQDSITDNSITNSTFTNIGGQYAPVLNAEGLEYQVATSVVGLVNSSRGIYRGNKFTNIENLKKYSETYKEYRRTSGLHAFYVAHHSSSNLFEGNEFTNHQSGAPIKIRDSSHNNTLAANVFKNVGPYAIQQWHCELNERGTSEENPTTGCTKLIPECLSMGTIGSGNGFDDTRKVLSLFEFSGTLKCLEQDPSKTVSAQEQIVLNDSVLPGNPRVFLLSSLFSSNIYYSICDQTTDCVNSKRVCYNSGGGSSHYLCSNTQWKICNHLNIGKQDQNFVCTENLDRSDAEWKKIPANTFYVRSFMGGQWNAQFCAQANACVNSKGICWQNQTGSSHMWCNANKWEVCNSSSVGKVMGTKVCTKVPNDYVWK